MQSALAVTSKLLRNVCVSKKKTNSTQKAKDETSLEPTGDSDIAEVLGNLPPEDRKAIMNMVSFSGPLPTPEMFKAYEDVLPGTGQEIVQFAKEEQKIRKNDNRHSLSNDSLRVLGSIAVSLALIAAAVYCGVIGQPWLGGVLGTSGTVAAIMSKAIGTRQR